MFWWYRHTRTWIISIYPSLSLFSFFFFLTLTHSWRLKAFYKMNRVFLRHEAYIIQEAKIPFFSLLTFFGASFYYLLLLLCFDIAFSFTLCLLLLFYTFAVHSYYYSYSSLSYYVKGMILTRVTKKERPVLQTKSSSNYIRIQKNMFQTGLYTLS